MRSILLVGYLLLAFIVSPISAQEESESPALEVITAENVQQIEQIGGLGRGYADAIAWSPDGEILAVASATGIWLYDTDFNQIDHWPDTYPSSIREFAWRPDGEVTGCRRSDDVGNLCK